LLSVMFMVERPRLSSKPSMPAVRLPFGHLVVRASSVVCFTSRYTFSRRLVESVPREGRKGLNAGLMATMNEMK